MQRERQSIKRLLSSFFLSSRVHEYGVCRHGRHGVWVECRRKGRE